jgi:hypothetical protein
VPRTVAQVGLGTARNFSTSRPIFQNLVENVPVAGRAFYEADWEIKMHKEREMKKPMKTKSHAKAATKEMLKPNPRRLSNKENVPAEEKEMEAQLDQYFPAPVVADVTTCLLIPLAPTPTTRTPLSENPTVDVSLLPLPQLASMHISHETHSLRVSSLFSRLDAANVWARNVQCSAFSHGGGPDGVCTMLKVEFVGWTKAEVRGVIGESGTGWCVLEEYKGARQIHPCPSEADEDTFSDTSSLFTNVFEDSESEDAVDPAQSLCLPVLDFSSSFQPPAPIPPSAPPSTSMGLYPVGQFDPDFDPWVDVEVSSEAGSSENGSWVHPLSVDGYFGFSSQYADRVDGRA